MFSHDPGCHDSNELCILLYTGGTATAETSVVRCVGFHTTKTYLKVGNCSEDKLLFFLKLSKYCSTFEEGTSCVSLTTERKLKLESLACLISVVSFTQT